MKEKLTIFTPTFNRKELLLRLYESLINQTRLDFEWIVVDDGSMDNTASLLKKIKNEEIINFSYSIKKVNGGKHRAINEALDLAHGEYFFIVDSDDVLPSNSVEKVYEYIKSIENLDDFAGVAGLKAHFNGEICGGKAAIHKREYVDATNFERLKYHLLDDKAEVYKTEVLRNHKFPEYEGENFISEAICWDAIASEGKKIRWFNDVIYLCEYLEDGLSRSGANKRLGHKKNIQGFSAYVAQSLNIKPAFENIADFREYNSTCKDLNQTINQRATNIGVTSTQYIMKITSIPFLYFIRKIIYSYYKYGG